MQCMPSIHLNHGPENYQEIALGEAKVCTVVQYVERCIGEYWPIEPSRNSHNIAFRFDKLWCSCRPLVKLPRDMWRYFQWIYQCQDAMSTANAIAYTSNHYTARMTDISHLRLRHQKTDDGKEKSAQLFFCCPLYDMKLQVQCSCQLAEIRCIQEFISLPISVPSAVGIPMKLYLNRLTKSRDRYRMHVSTSRGSNPPGRARIFRGDKQVLATNAKISRAAWTETLDPVKGDKSSQNSVYGLSSRKNCNVMSRIMVSYCRYSKYRNTLTKLYFIIIFYTLRGLTLLPSRWNTRHENSLLLRPDHV